MLTGGYLLYDLTHGSEAMLVNKDQKAVFMLALLVLRQNNLSIAQLLSGTDIHYNSAGRPTMFDWALDYIRCLPENSADQDLLRHLHLDPAYQWTPQQAKRASLCYKAFYRCLDEKRLYAKGVNWLNSGGRKLLQDDLRDKLSTLSIVTE